MSKEIKITKLTLKTADGKIVELSLDEARELHSQLDALFGEKTRYIGSSPIIIRDRWPYRGPYWESPVWGRGHVTCESRSGMSLCASVAPVR